MAGLNGVFAFLALVSLGIPAAASVADGAGNVRAGQAAIAGDAAVALAPDVDYRPEMISMSRREWERHETLPWNRYPSIPFRNAAATDEPVDLGDLVVFGYLPYWTVGDVTLHLDILTHIAYFSVAVDSAGNLGDSRHWGGAVMDEIVAAAHSSGVKVVLTITNFTSSSQEALLNSATNRRNAIENIVDLVVAGDGDGANIDFEGLPLAAKAGFVTFVQDLKAAMDAAIGESSVTLAMPAVDWRGAYDYDALALACDGLFLMEYDFHYAGGSPGPLAPLAGSTKWGKYSVTWSLDDYDTYGGVQNRDRFIMGMPLYGYDWPATGTVPPSSAAGDADSVSYAGCLVDGPENGLNWDEDSSTPWYDYYLGGQYHQVWCDNDESLSMRMALARERGLAGIGFWALGYEGAHDGPWQAIVDTWGPGTDPGTGDELAEHTGDLATDPDVINTPDAIAGDGGLLDLIVVDAFDAGTDRDTTGPGDAASDSGTVEGQDAPADELTDGGLRPPGDGGVLDRLRGDQGGGDLPNADAAPPDLGGDSGPGILDGGASCSATGRPGLPALASVLVLVLAVLLLTCARPILCRRRERH